MPIDRAPAVNGLKQPARGVAQHFEKKKQWLIEGIKNGEVELGAVAASKAERAALTQQFRKGVADKVVARFGKDTPRTQSLLRQLKKLDADHVIELQLGGKNSSENLRLLCSSVNRSVGSQMSKKIKEIAKTDAAAIAQREKLLSVGKQQLKQLQAQTAIVGTTKMLMLIQRREAEANRAVQESTEALQRVVREMRPGSAIIEAQENLDTAKAKQAAVVTERRHFEAIMPDNTANTDDVVTMANDQAAQHATSGNERQRAEAQRVQTQQQDTGEQRSKSHLEEARQEDLRAQAQIAEVHNGRDGREKMQQDELQQKKAQEEQAKQEKAQQTQAQRNGTQQEDHAQHIVQKEQVQQKEQEGQTRQEDQAQQKEQTQRKEQAQQEKAKQEAAERERLEQMQRERERELNSKLEAEQRAKKDEQLLCRQ